VTNGTVWKATARATVLPMEEARAASWLHYPTWQHTGLRAPYT
jgi:hypothetical protein